MIQFLVCACFLRPEKGKGKPSQFGSSREWYSGWSCMTILINKGLVVKSSCPAKYGFSFRISIHPFDLGSVIC